MGTNPARKISEHFFKVLSLYAFEHFYLTEYIIINLTFQYISKIIHRAIHLFSLAITIVLSVWSQNLDNAAFKFLNLYLNQILNSKVCVCKFVIFIWKFTSIHLISLGNIYMLHVRIQLSAKPEFFTLIFNVLNMK